MKKRRPISFRQYVDESERSLSEIARDIGVPVSTAHRWYSDDVPRLLLTANAIIKFSQENPTPSGGIVTFEELVTSKDAA